MAGKKVSILLNAIYVSLTQKREGHITAWELNIVLYWSQLKKKQATLPLLPENIMSLNYFNFFSFPDNKPYGINTLFLFFHSGMWFKICFEVVT